MGRAVNPNDGAATKGLQTKPVPDQKEVGASGGMVMCHMEGAAGNGSSVRGGKLVGQQPFTLERALSERLATSARLSAGAHAACLPLKCCSGGNHAICPSAPLPGAVPTCCVE